MFGGMKPWLAAATILLGACNPAPAAAPAAPMTPAASAGAAGAPRSEEACVLEGDGEPLDEILYHEPPPLTVSATRTGAPLVVTQGQARYELHGRWTDIGSDGRARVELTRPGTLRLTGYADLAAVRFRLRKEAVVVPGHVFLQKNALVRVVSASSGQADVVSERRFEPPRTLASRLRCSDLGYEPIDRAYDEPNDDATASVATVRLFDRPGGELRFEANVGLMFVRELEQRDGFVRIEGQRYRVRIAGWTPRELVDHEPRGSGFAGGSRHGSSSHRRGREARVANPTPLSVRAGAAPPAEIGELEAGAKVTVTGEGAELVAIDLADIAATDGGTLLVRASDLDRE
jgi:hypothetical protein